VSVPREQSVSTRREDSYDECDRRSVSSNR
jgi:hypothetical protein